MTSLGSTSSDDAAPSKKSMADVEDAAEAEFLNEHTAGALYHAGVCALQLVTTCA